MISLIPYRDLTKPDQHSNFHRKCFGNRWYIFYGPKTPKSSFFLQNTGKSPTQHAVQDPVDFIQLLHKTTSSGVVKHLSPEVFDILNKLMKSDEDNSTGDVQLLCKLFSGERCSYHYSMKETWIIPSNTTFSILGSTQLLNAAKLIAKMDHGHGLIDSILIATL